MEPEAPELRRSAVHGGQQIRHEPHQVAPVSQVRRAVQPDGRDQPSGAVDGLDLPVPTPGEPLGCLGPGQGVANAGMPAPELSGPQRVVGEEEVLDRMGPLGLDPLAVGGRQIVDAPLVGLGACDPLERRQEADARCRAGLHSTNADIDRLLVVLPVTPPVTLPVTPATDQDQAATAHEQCEPEPAQGCRATAGGGQTGRRRNADGRRRRG